MVKLNQKHLNIGLLVLFAALAVLRFTDLDADAPAYNLAGINTTDEPYYCIYGLNDHLESESRLIKDLQNQNTSFLMQHNYLMTRLGLSVFGTTYYGLRLGVVLASLLAIWLLFLSLRKQYLLSVSRQFLVLLFIGIESSFFIFSRFQTPQFYSIFWSILVFYAFVSIRSKFLNGAIVAALIIISVVWVYPYLAYVSIGYLLWVLVESFRSKSFTGILASAMGLAAGVGFISVAFLINGDNPLAYFDFLSSINEVRDESQSSFSLRQIFISLLQIPYTNLIRFNPILGVMGMVGAGYTLVNYQKSTPLGRFAAFILISAFLQSFFIHSYPFKKWVTLMPVLVILATELLLAINFQKSKWRFVWYASIPLIAALVAKGVLTSNQSLYWSGFAEDYNIELLPYGVNYFYVSCAGFSLVLVIALIWKRSMFTYAYAAMILTAVFTTSSYLSNTTFEFRNSLKGFSSEIDKNTLIIGDFPHAFAFYNTGQVAHNPYSLVFNFIQSEQVDQVVSRFDRSIIIKKNLNQHLSPEIINLYGSSYKREFDQTLMLYIRQR